MVTAWKQSLQLYISSIRCPMPRFNESMFSEILTVRDLSRFNLTAEKKVLLESAIKKIKIVQLHELYGRFVEGILAGVIDNEESVDKKKKFLELATLTDITEPVINDNNNELTSKQKIFTLKCYKQNPQTKAFEAREEEDEQLLKSLSGISQDKDDYQTVHKIRHQYLLNKLYHVRNNNLAFTETMSNMLLGRTEPAPNGTPKVVSKYFVNGSPSLTQEEWQVMQEVYPRESMNDKIVRREAHLDLELTLKEMQNLILSAVTAAIENNRAPLDQELLPAKFTVEQQNNYENYTQEGLFSLVESEKNNDELIKILKADKSYINAIDHHTGRSLLSYAVKCQNKAIVKYLIKNGADVNKTDNTRYSVLHYAVEGNSAGIVRKVIKYLNKESFNLNAEDWGGYTPLYLAAEMGKTGFIKLILPEIDDPNLANNKRGCSPLYIAVMKGHVEAAKALLKHSKTDPNLTTKGWHGEKETPRGLALKAGGAMRELFIENTKSSANNNNNSSPQNQNVPATLWRLPQALPQAIATTPSATSITNNSLPPFSRVIPGQAPMIRPVKVSSTPIAPPTQQQGMVQNPGPKATQPPAAQANPSQADPSVLIKTNQRKFETILSEEGPITAQNRQFLEDYTSKYQNPYKQLKNQEFNNTSSDVREKFRQERELATLANTKIQELAKKIADWPKQTFAASYYEASKLLAKLDKEPNSLTYYAVAFELCRYNPEYKYSYVGILEKLKQNITPMHIAIDESSLDVIKLILIENPNRENEKIICKENLSSIKTITLTEVEYAIKNGQVNALNAMLETAKEKPEEIKLGNVPADALMQAENIRAIMQNKSYAHREAKDFFGIDIEKESRRNFKKLMRDLEKSQSGISDERVNGFFTKEEYLVVQYGMGDMEKKVVSREGYLAETPSKLRPAWLAHFKLRKMLTHFCKRAEELNRILSDSAEVNNNNNMETDNSNGLKLSPQEELQYIRSALEKTCGENPNVNNLNATQFTAAENFSYIYETTKNLLNVKNNVTPKSANILYKALRKVQIPENQPVKLNKLEHVSTKNNVEKIKHDGKIISPRDAMISGKVNYLSTPMGTQGNIFFSHEGRVTPLRENDPEIIQVMRAQAIKEGLLKSEHVYTSPHIPAYSVARVEKPIEFIGDDPSKKTIYRVYHLFPRGESRKKIHWFDYVENNIVIESKKYEILMEGEFFEGINIKATNYRFIDFLRKIKGPFAEGSYYHYVINNPFNAEIQDSARGAIFNVLNSEAKVTESFSVEHPAVKIIKNPLAEKYRPLEVVAKEKINTLITQGDLQELKSTIESFMIYKEQLFFALEAAIKSSQKNIVEYLLDIGVDAFAYNSKALVLALDAFVKEVEFKSDRSTWDEKAKNSYQLFTLLLQHGAANPDDPSHIKYLPALDTLTQLEDQSWKNTGLSDLKCIINILFRIKDLDTQKLILDNLSKLLYSLKFFTMQNGFEELHHHILQRLDHKEQGLNSPEAKKWIAMIEQDNVEEIMSFLGEKEKNAGVEGNNSNFYILTLAIRRNKPAIVEKIYDYFKKTAMEAEFPALQLAYYFKQYEVAKVLLAKNPHNAPNFLNLNTLYHIVQSGVTEVPELILKHENDAIEHSNYYELFTYGLKAQSMPLIDLVFGKLFINGNATHSFLYNIIVNIIEGNSGFHQSLMEKILPIYQRLVEEEADDTKLTNLIEYTDLLIKISQESKNPVQFSNIFEGLIKFIGLKFEMEREMDEQTTPNYSFRNIQIYKQFKNSIYYLLDKLIESNNLELYRIAVIKLNSLGSNLLFKFNEYNEFPYISCALGKFSWDYIKILWEDVPLIFETDVKKEKSKKSTKSIKVGTQVLNPLDLIYFSIENPHDITIRLIKELKLPFSKEMDKRIVLICMLIKLAKPELLKWFFENGYLFKDELSSTNESYLFNLQLSKITWDERFLKNIGPNLTVLTDEIGFNINQQNSKGETLIHVVKEFNELDAKMVEHAFYHPKMNFSLLDNEKNTLLHAMIKRLQKGYINKVNDINSPYKNIAPEIKEELVKNAKAAVIESLKKAIEHFAVRGGDFNQKNLQGKNVYETYTVLFKEAPDFADKEIRSLFEEKGVSLELSFFNKAKNNSMIYTAGARPIGTAGDLYLFVQEDGNYLFLEDKPTMFFGSETETAAPFSAGHLLTSTSIENKNLVKPKPNGGWVKLHNDMISFEGNIYNSQIYIKNDSNRYELRDIALKVGPIFKLFIKYSMSKDGMKDQIFKLKKYKNKQNPPIAMESEDREILTQTLLENKKIFERILLGVCSTDKEKVDQSIEDYSKLKDSLEVMEFRITLYKNSTYYEYNVKHPIEAAILADNQYAIQQIFEKIKFEDSAWSTYIFNAILLGNNVDTIDFISSQLTSDQKLFGLVKTYYESICGEAKQNKLFSLSYPEALIKVLELWSDRKPNSDLRTKWKAMAKEFTKEITKSLIIKDQKDLLLKTISSVDVAHASVSRKKSANQNNEEMDEIPLIHKRKSTVKTETKAKKPKGEENNNNNVESEAPKKASKRKASSKTFLDDDLINEKSLPAETKKAAKKPRVKKSSIEPVEVSKSDSTSPTTPSPQTLSPTFGSGVKVEVSTTQVKGTLFSLVNLATVASSTLQASSPADSNPQTNSTNNNNNNHQPGLKK